MHTDEELKALKARLADKLWGPAVQGVDVQNNAQGQPEFTVLVDAPPAVIRELPGYVEGYKVNYQAGRVVKH